MLKRQVWFRADSGPPGHWWRRGHFFFAPNPYNIGVYRPKGMQRSLCLFCSQPQQYGCQQTPLDTNSQDLPFWADSGPPGHWLHQGHFFCSKFLQYGCLRTPLDPSNQDLAFWVDSGQPGHWGLWGLVEATLLFLFQTPTIFSLDTRFDQDLTFWAESGQPGHWGLQGYA